ncbi:ferrichrome-binding protein (plasmid) [Halostagnicola larsenii XH-48]|uniref:Ferrichrome-binding protein n=1 Tax=Halostagnicola larsenii XH-48 TaxID=797299 RepID=W0JVY4_9EURY|nr:ABC transporter substrate-binding protein [Halostagnicola larsenii]AHG01482.1 ferrichrome-binding protein [Halostagnicola larsenii XH-48]
MPAQKETDATEEPTRRDYMRYGGTIVGGGLLAGCLGDGDTSPDTNTAEGYTATIAPVGEVTFDAPPKSIFTRLTHLAGMAFALGRGNDVNAMHAPDYYDALWNQFTPHLEGVSLDWTGLYSSWEPDKEQLYELNSDVHLADPASMFALGSWDMDDIEEIATNIGPWFGNTFSDRNEAPPDEWADQYQYYTLWEQFERVAQVFRAEERYQALSEIHTDLLETIESGLPPAADRPTAVLVGMSDIESIYAYTLNTPGFLTAHLRPLEPVGAFGDEVSSGDTVDMEAMLEADPDVIFSMGGMHPETDMVAIRENLTDHSVAREISAVENDRVYAQGARYQGPILNLFQLEMTAKQLYPDQFGTWPTYETGPYPEIPVDERLFDRGRVADIVNGNFER